MPIVGMFAAGASLLIIAFGLPGQIVMNYRRKSCEGLAPSLVYSASISYTLWCWYGWSKPDLFLKIAQTPGCVLMLIILFQLLKYGPQRLPSLVARLFGRRQQ